MQIKSVCLMICLCQCFMPGGIRVTLLWYSSKKYEPMALYSAKLPFNYKICRQTALSTWELRFHCFHESFMSNLEKDFFQKTKWLVRCWKQNQCELKIYTDLYNSDKMMTITENHTYVIAISSGNIVKV